MPYPVNAPFRFDRSTPESAYKAGYKTGMSWNGSWRPSGPYVPEPDHNQDPEWMAYVEFKKQCRKAWRLGFDEGRAFAAKRAMEVG